MTNFVARFVKDESGATAIEYGLIAMLNTALVDNAALVTTCYDHTYPLGSGRPLN